MSKDNIRLTVSATDLASGTLGKVKASTVALGVAVGNLATKMLTGALNGLRGWVNEALEAEKANVMLDAALRGVGRYTPELAKQFRDLASAIQDETGKSDEAVKSNIAMLTTLGVMPDKMGQAARAVDALASLGRDGAQAMTAVARAVEGDLEAFERFAPEVRNAATITEKVAAINRLVTAGYEQQKATLQTVGGAWEALKGRLGDAREEIIGAVFEGSKIGRTFDDAQAAVGRFLQSDSFKTFTDRLRDGAAYVRQIVQAMGTDGGAREVASAFGDVILAALKDGADYVGASIRKALTGDKPTFGETRVKLATFFGTPEEEARRTVYGGADRFGHVEKEDAGGGNLERALARLDAVIKKRAAAAEKTGWTYDTLDENLAASANASADALVSEAKIREQIARKAEQQLRDLAKRDAENARILAAEQNVAAAYERERAAVDAAAAAAAQRAAFAQKNIADWMNERRGGRAAQEERDKAVALENRNAARLMRKLGAKPGDDPEQAIENAAKKGRRLSKQEERELRDWAALPKERQRAQEIADALKHKAGQAELDRKGVEAQLQKIQQDQLTELRKLNANLEQNLQVP